MLAPREIRGGAQTRHTLVLGAGARAAEHQRGARLARAGVVEPSMADEEVWVGLCVHVLKVSPRVPPHRGVLWAAEDGDA